MPRRVPTSLASARMTARSGDKPMTQRQIAKALGVSAAYMCYLEQGRMLPTRAELLKLAKTYSVDPTSLYPEPWSSALLAKGSA